MTDINDSVRRTDAGKVAAVLLERYYEGMATPEEAACLSSMARHAAGNPDAPEFSNELRVELALYLKEEEAFAKVFSAMRDSAPEGLGKRLSEHVGRLAARSVRRTWLRQTVISVSVSAAAVAALVFAPGIGDAGRDQASVSQGMLAVGKAGLEKTGVRQFSQVEEDTESGDELSASAAGPAKRKTAGKSVRSRKTKVATVAEPEEFDAGLEAPYTQEELMQALNIIEDSFEEIRGGRDLIADISYTLNKSYSVSFDISEVIPSPKDIVTQLFSGTSEILEKVYDSADETEAETEPGPDSSSDSAGEPFEDVALPANENE